MAELRFTKGTDSENKIKLESSLIFAEWRAGGAYAGQTAAFEVGTAFVGNGATIKIKGKSENGKKLGKIKKVIKNNKFIGRFDIPEDIEVGDEIYFEVKLPKNGLDGESSRIPILQAPKISNMKWSAEEARRGDILKLTADVEDVYDGTEATVTIYEYDDDGANEKITEIPTTVENKKVEVEWEYEYHEDTDEIPTEEEIREHDEKGHYAHPEYYFVIDINGFKAGEKQESGLLEFKDSIEFNIIGVEEDSQENIKYKLYLPDGSTKEGKADSEGKIFENNISPGRCKIELPDE
jgi:hypothetical protein